MLLMTLMHVLCMQDSDLFADLSDARQRVDSQPAAPADISSDLPELDSDELGLGMLDGTEVSWEESSAASSRPAVSTKQSTKKHRPPKGAACLTQPS